MFIYFADCEQRGLVLIVVMETSIARISAAAPFFWLFLEKRLISFGLTWKPGGDYQSPDFFGDLPFSWEDALFAPHSQMRFYGYFGFSVSHRN